MTETTEKKTISVASEVTALSGGAGRCSTGSTIPESSVSHSNTGEKILPNYLRASTRSCHDSCKHGRKHAVEEKGNQPILHGLGNKPSLNKEYHQSNVLSLGDQMKRPVIKSKPLTLPKLESHVKSGDIRQKDFPLSNRYKSGEKSVGIEPPTASNTCKDILSYDVTVPSTTAKTTISDDINKRQVIRSKSLPYFKSINEESNSEPKDVPSKPGKYEEKMAAPPVKKADTSTASMLVGRKSLPMACMKTQIIEQMASASSRNVIAAKKTVISSNRKISSKENASSLVISSRNSSIQQSQDKIETSDTMKKTKDKKPISASDDEADRCMSIETTHQSAPPATPDEPVGAEGIKNPESPKGNSISHGRTDNFHELSEPLSLDVQHFEESETSSNDSASEDGGEENARNEDFCKVEGSSRITTTANQSTRPSDEELIEESESVSSESIESASENVVVESIRIDELSKAEGSRPKRITTLQPESSILSPYKLKFKEGKVIELPPDRNVPGKLSFRKERAHGEFPVNDGQVGKERYRRQNEMGVGMSNDQKAEAPVVVLRHQDSWGKKDPQGLLNNVIEETASRLVEARKSKVKALVGAFETVISLQDGKPH